jgi:DUF1680 family protein
MVIPAILSILIASTFAPPGDVKLRPFDYRGVRIDSGPFRQQLDEVKNFYLRIPNDDLLKGFRTRAGLPAPGVDLGGWYSADVFHIFGQIISGLSRLYAATGDTACKDKVFALVGEWGKTIAPDGYFYYTTKPNARHYIYDKMVCGLVDAYLYCADREALGYLSKITDWAIKNLSRERTYNFTSGNGYTEWYTLSENLYRAYDITRDRKYLNFAKVWEYTEYWDLYAARKYIFSRATGYHAYSHVNTLSGAGAAYMQTQEQHYLDTIKHAYEYLHGNECFATGGYGPNESLLPPALLPRTLENWTNHFETQCGTWAVFKLCKYLIMATGDGRYGNWVEELAYNGLGATIPMSPDGKVFYYSEYSVDGSSKRNSDTGWTCCAGTRPQAVADVVDQIYYQDGLGFFINLFVPSTVQWQGHSITQRTRFPESGWVAITIHDANHTQFSIHLRAPDWLDGKMTAAVNGEALDLLPPRQGWFTVRRSWQDGDVLWIRLPMKISQKPIAKDAKYPTAITYGPVAMAFRSSANPGDIVNFGALSANFIPSLGEPLTYHLKSDPSVLVRPFYAFKAGESYYLYLDPAARNRVSWRAVKLDKWYGDAGYMRYTDTIGATAEYTFEGTGIRWRGQKFDDGGQAKVEIDGTLVGIVDMYGPGRGLPFDWRHTDLPKGKHTIKITLIATKSTESKGTFLNLQGFEVIP